jgi:signal peptidase II
VAVAIIVFLVILDQITKDWVTGLLAENAFRPVELTSFFNLVMVWNTGVSFGMFAGDGNSAHWLLVLLPGLVALALAVWMFRSVQSAEIFGLAFVIGGATGNLTDRIYRGAVADFFDFHVAGWHFWAFNVADAAISIGVAILLYDAFFNASKSDA